MLVFLSLIFIQLYAIPCTFSPAYATYDPLSVPNNKFGIHIISGTDDEASPAADLVDSSGGDWGYVTVLIQSGERDVSRWQTFFNNLRRRHLIPLVRLATQPEDSYWKRPYDGEEVAWADFLDNLIWPTKNRYVIIYNEPNQGKEWGNVVDPESYTQSLSKTIDALKKKNADFFVLNAGFDASAPDKAPGFMDEWNFLQQMNKAVPGIFNKLDGWVSHSYPNPGFVGLPDKTGRGTVAGWSWEAQKLTDLGVTKQLPIFITETGWRHAEGINFDKSLPDADTVADYYKKAFHDTWSSLQIVAVTPFLLNYQDAPFDHFSFKKLTGEKQNYRILGAQYPAYYSPYQTIKDLPKIAGKPIQENKATLTGGEVYSSLVAGQSYTVLITFKNSGQSIWNEDKPVKLAALSSSKELSINDVVIPADKKIEPGQDYTFQLNFKAPLYGKYQVQLNLFQANKQFDSKVVQFTTEVKAPVVLKINSNLQWKDNPAGQYLLKITGAIGENIEKVNLDNNGQSLDLEARYLLPGYTFSFTLGKPFYKPKTIEEKVNSGENILNFGTLQPDFISALLHPVQLWKLLPFSR